ncbi:MAG: GntR family transcriptional regulator [Clostridia bacterium]|nr:GntR family transcriptional regulator [Clostridia bacterium]
MIDIDVKSRVPIYKQIYTQIETLALTGIYEPGSQIMSVRQLAKLIGINPNTITKAYSELEQNGIIYSVPGRGSFISPDLKVVGKEKQEEVLSELNALAQTAASLGVPEERALNEVRAAYTNAKEVTK